MFIGIHLIYFRALQIGELFHEFDRDHNGSVSMAEAKLMLDKLNMSEDEVKGLIAIHDKNEDGELQYDEFVTFLLQN